MATLGAGPVTGGEGGGFVQEKQLSPRAWGHDGAQSAAKLQSTGDPAPDLRVAHDVALSIVQNAPVAHERASPRQRQDFAERGHPVAQRHRRRSAIERTLI